MDGWIDGSMDGWMDGWMDKWMDVDGLTDGWMNGVALAPNLTAKTSFITLGAFTR